MRVFSAFHESSHLAFSANSGNILRHPSKPHGLSWLFHLVWALFGSIWNLGISLHFQTSTETGSPATVRPCPRRQKYQEEPLPRHQQRDLWGPLSWKWWGPLDEFWWSLGIRSMILIYFRVHVANRPYFLWRFFFFLQTQCLKPPIEDSVVNKNPCPVHYIPIRFCFWGVPLFPCCLVLSVKPQW